MRILYSRNDHNYDSFSTYSSIEIYCVFCLCDNIYYTCICMCMIRCIHTCVHYRRYVHIIKHIQYIYMWRVSSLTPAVVRCGIRRLRPHPLIQGRSLRSGVIIDYYSSHTTYTPYIPYTPNTVLYSIVYNIILFIYSKIYTLLILTAYDIYIHLYYICM